MSGTELLTVVELIQKATAGYRGGISMKGSDTVLEIFSNRYGDPMYGNVDAADSPMDQPTFFRNYEHHMFGLDAEITVSSVGGDDEESDDDDEPDEDDEPAGLSADQKDLIAWARNPETPEQDLSDYLVEVAGEDRRNWKRNTMKRKIIKYVKTGSAD